MVRKKVQAKKRTTRATKTKPAPAATPPKPKFVSNAELYDLPIVEERIEPPPSTPLRSLALSIDRRRDAFGHTTGIRVKATRGANWTEADIGQLTTSSLFMWLRAHGGKSIRAEEMVAKLLDHSEEDIRKSV